MYRRVHFAQALGAVSFARKGGFARKLRVKARNGERWHIFSDRDCLNPKSLHLSARSSEGKRLIVLQTIRCRKCETCAAARARSWMARACAQYRHSARTWFVTLTGKPSFHDEIDRRCEAAEGGFWLLGEPQKTTLRIRQWKLEGQRYLKRLRKQLEARGSSSSGNVRYMLVAELHPGKHGNQSAVTGKPHFHVLIHERVAGAAVEASEAFQDAEGVTWLTEDAMVRKTWTGGYSSATLCVDEKAAAYICKYMWKDDTLTTRLQASLRYGDSWSDPHQQRDDSELLKRPQTGRQEQGPSSPRSADERVQLGEQKGGSKTPPDRVEDAMRERRRRVAQEHKVHIDSSGSNRYYRESRGPP